MTGVCVCCGGISIANSDIDVCPSCWKCLGCGEVKKFSKRYLLTGEIIAMCDKCGALHKDLKTLEGVFAVRGKKRMTKAPTSNPCAQVSKAFQIKTCHNCGGVGFFTGTRHVFCQACYHCPQCQHRGSLSVNGLGPVKCNDCGYGWITLRDFEIDLATHLQISAPSLAPTASSASNPPLTAHCYLCKTQLPRGVNNRVCPPCQECPRCGAKYQHLQYTGISAVDCSHCNTHWAVYRDFEDELLASKVNLSPKPVNTTCLVCQKSSVSLTLGFCSNCYQCPQCHSQLSQNLVSDPAVPGGMKCLSCSSTWPTVTAFRYAVKNIPTIKTPGPTLSSCQHCHATPVRTTHLNFCDACFQCPQCKGLNVSTHGGTVSCYDCGQGWKTHVFFEADLLSFLKQKTLNQKNTPTNWAPSVSAVSSPCYNCGQPGHLSLPSSKMFCNGCYKCPVCSASGTYLKYTVVSGNTITTCDACKTQWPDMQMFEQDLLACLGKTPAQPYPTGPRCVCCGTLNQVIPSVNLCPNCVACPTCGVSNSYHISNGPGWTFECMTCHALHQNPHQFTADVWAMFCNKTNKTLVNPTSRVNPTSCVCCGSTTNALCSGTFICTQCRVCPDCGSSDVNFFHSPGSFETSCRMCPSKYTDAAKYEQAVVTYRKTHKWVLNNNHSSVGQCLGGKYLDSVPESQCMQVFGINPRHVGLLYFTHCVVLKPSPDEASALEVLPNYLRVKTADAELIDRNATKRPNYVATSADSKIRYYYFSPVNTPPIDWLKV